MASPSIISGKTHVPVYDGDNLVITNEKMLIQEKSSGNLIYVPFNKNMCKVFGMILQDDDQTKNNNVDPKNEVGTRQITQIINESEAEVENQISDIEEFFEDSNAEETRKLWTRDRINYLIEVIEEFSHRLDTDVKKYVWETIAKKCGEEFKTTITFRQVESKWKSLKRTYKSVLLHNNTSGKQKRYWEFFQKMHGFMYKRPEIIPTATCSNTKGLQIKNKNGSNSEATIVSDDDESGPNCPSGGQMGLKKFETSFSRKRKNRESEVAKRHKEKMSKLDRFNDLFEKMIEKM